MDAATARKLTDSAIKERISQIEAEIRTAIENLQSEIIIDDQPRAIEQILMERKFTIRPWSLERIKITW